MAWLGRNNMSVTSILCIRHSLVKRESPRTMMLLYVHLMEAMEFGLKTTGSGS